MVRTRWDCVESKVHIHVTSCFLESERERGREGEKEGRKESGKGRIKDGRRVGACTYMYKKRPHSQYSEPSV